MYLLNELGDQPGPPGLVTGPQPATIVAVEVFVEQQQIAPVRILLEDLARAIDWPAALLVAKEDPRQPTLELETDVPEIPVLSRSSGTFDVKVVPEKIVKLLQGFDDQEIDRKPDGSAPVRVAAEAARSRLRRLVLDAVPGLAQVQQVRMIVVHAG